jgi:hypothetical protein
MGVLEDEHAEMRWREVGDLADPHLVQGVGGPFSLVFPHFHSHPHLHSLYSLPSRPFLRYRWESPHIPSSSLHSL